MGRILARLALSLFPLALTPGLGFLLAEGYVNLGAGCKDIFAVIPWLVWAFGYFVCSLVFWWKGAPVRRAVLYAAIWATGFILKAVEEALALFVFIGGLQQPRAWSLSRRSRFPPCTATSC